MAKDIVTKAEILGGEIDVRANFGQTVKVTVSPDPYMGDTEVTPSAETQVLATKKKFVQDDITVLPAPTEYLSTDHNGTFTPSDGKVGFSQVNVDVNPDLRPLSVSENGQYSPDGFDGYSEVTVDVHNHSYSEDYDDFSGGNILALISHGEEYINTEYYPKVCTEYFLKATKDKHHGRYENLFASLFGSIGTRVGIQMDVNSMTNVAYFVQPTTSVSNVPSSLSTDVPTILSTRHLLSADPDTVATKPLLIFYGYYSAGFDQKGQFNFYGLKCYDFGTLVKKYVPWLDENNVPCVHELVDDEYFYNVGTGTFGYIDLEGNVHDA